MVAAKENRMGGLLGKREIMAKREELVEHIQVQYHNLNQPLQED